MRKVSMVELFGAKRTLSFRFIREEEVTRMIASISKSSSKAINLSDLLMTLTSSIICRVACGKCYTGEGSEKADFKRLLGETQNLLVAFFVANFIPWHRQD
ncbi:hypothetical protein AAC387_Pa07g1497 [Persea americana]